MLILIPTLEQMAFLFLLLLAGYILARFDLVPFNGAGVLSKLENNLLVPALVMSTFMQNFTVHHINTAGQYLLCGFAVVCISIFAALAFARLCTKDRYIQKISTYGLAFSNFGFMGNAVVSALFPELFMEYLIFVLPFWFCIYMWGVPVLLIPRGEGKQGWKERLRPLLNPMFFAMLIGMAVGISGLQIPGFLQNAVSSLGDCMSPLAMLLTGMTIAKIDLRATFRNVTIYLVTAIRLLLIPGVAIALLAVFPLPYGLALCTVCALAMPLGLTSIIIPSAYGQDTSVAAGMALISHLFSCLTIPLIFMLFEIAVH